jgi:hypothetical protein
MPNYAEIMKSLNICVTLYHAYEALIRCGMRAFLNFYEGRKPSLYSIVLSFYPCRAYQQPPPARQHRSDPNNERSARLFGSCARGANLAGRNIRRSKSKIRIFESLRNFFSKIPASTKFGHPKFYKLRDILISHFTNSDSSTRIIVFFEYRESASEAYALLSQSYPMIRSRVFVGQGSGVTQRDQINVNCPSESWKINNRGFLDREGVSRRYLQHSPVDLHRRGGFRCWRGRLDCVF